MTFPPEPHVFFYNIQEWSSNLSYNLHPTRAQGNDLTHYQPSQPDHLLNATFKSRSYAGPSVNAVLC